MRADQDDIPEHIRTRKKESPWRFVAILGIGSAIFWGLVTLFAKPVVIDIAQIKKGIHVSGTPWFNQEQAKPAEPTQYYQPPAQPKPTRATVQRELTPEEIEWFDEASKNAERKIQTSFNDQNYQPRGAVNSIPPPAVRYDSTNETSKPRAKKEIVVVGKEERPEDWICSYSGKEGSIKRRECKMRYQLQNRN